MTQTAVLASVAETNGLKTKQAKGVVEALMAVACDQIKKNGNFTKEPCVFKAKPASKTVKVYAMEKLKESLTLVFQKLRQ